ncbi:MAG: methyltransferase domain-containing protein [Pyrinomonadaceae bacterium]|nr:methyltransferase domain-containing protein [Pyrinomonadaceae bacterium]
MQNAVTESKPKVEAGSFYDRVASLYNLTFKFNGYARSLEQYLRANPLPLTRGAKILDAGCGTGLLTLALLKAVDMPVQITAIDLSSTSIATARRAVKEEMGRTQTVAFSQANVLQLPFRDNTFDVIVTSGVLEYVSLREGFGELARVLAVGGHLLHLPVRPSLASRFLELLFHFKTHPPDEVEANTSRYFNIISHHRFPRFHVIGWTKSAVVAQKV